MTDYRFLQIHTLTSYPASLLNRDDVGFAKRIPFGGSVRTRISSQCLKRHWRVFDGENALQGITIGDEPVPMSVRSRITFDRFIRQPLVNEGVDPAVAEKATASLMAELLGESEKSKKTASKKKQNGDESAEPAALATGQITVLGRPELEFLLGQARAIAASVSADADDKTVRQAVKEHLTRERRDNLRAMRLGAGLDAAMFGRMVTSDVLARGDAALHVAHAFTVHEEHAESDYFSAVDDLRRTDEEESLGSGHIGSAELTSGLFYGYVVVDLPLLVSNLEGCDRKEWASHDRGLAAEVVRRMIHLIATVSPGAKLGSTAPHSYAHAVLVEAGNAQPRTLANAFLSPIRGDDLVEASYAALARHLGELDGMYGSSTERRLAAIGPRDRLSEVVREHGSLANAADWASACVRGQT